jgi:hypothetical protein
MIYTTGTCPHCETPWQGEQPDDCCEGRELEIARATIERLERSTRPAMQPYASFVDASDIDYPHDGTKLPVIVVALEKPDGEFGEVATVVAPNGERYTCPAGLLYTTTVQAMAIPPEANRS